MPEKLFASLTSLANTLNVPVKKLWPLLVKQEIVVGFTSLIWSLGFFIIILVLFKWVKYLKTLPLTPKYQEDPSFWVGFIYFFIAISCVMIVAILQFAVIHIITPEACAITRLININGN